MTTNILDIVEKITEKNPDWKMLYRKLKINGEVVDMANFTPYPFPYQYQNLELIERVNGKIIWTDITAVGRECSIELQNQAEFDDKGNFVRGIMNTFCSGFQKMDIPAIKELFYEIKDRFSSTDYWDLISAQRDDSILKNFNIPHIGNNTENNHDGKGINVKDKDEIMLNLSKSFKDKDYSLCRQLINYYFDGLHVLDVKALVDNLPKEIKYQACLYWLKIIYKTGFDLKSADPMVTYFTKLNYDFVNSRSNSELNKGLSKETIKKISKLICPICNKQISSCRCLSV